MPELAQVADLINDIYDAALDSSRWPNVLRRMMALVDGVSAAIFSDAALPGENFYCSVDVDPQFAALYAAHYVGLNPLIPFEENLPAGPVIEKSPRRMVKLMVNRHERKGPVDASARETMQLLAPHFRRALAISRALERSESKAAALGDVLDRLSAAVVFVDKAGRLVHANGPAAALLAEGECLRWEDGKPRPQCERAALHLRSLLAAASRVRPSGSAAAPYGGTQTTSGGERVAVHILPVPAGSRRYALAPCAAVAAILVSRPAPDLMQRVQAASRMYTFTPAEERVVQALLGGGTVGSVAGVLGIAEATVKTHLQHVFDKTGTRRRADLVQLIAVGSGPAGALAHSRGRGGERHQPLG